MTDYSGSGGTSGTDYSGGGVSLGSAAPKPSGGGGGGLGGLFHEAAGLVPNAIIGAGHFAGTLAGDVGHTYARDYSLVRHQGPLALFNLKNDPMGAEHTHTPKQIGASFARTGGDIIHPTHFAQAYSHGHLLGKLVEDLANASIVGSAVDRPLAGSAAASEEAATAAETAAEQAAKEAETAREAESAAHELGHSTPNADPVQGARLISASEAARAAEAHAAELADAAEEARGRATRIGQLSEHLKSVQKLTGTGSNPIELAGKAVKGAVGGAVDLASRIPEESRLSPVSDAAGRLQGIAREHGEAKLAKGVLRQQKFESAREATPLINAGVERARILQNPTEEAASTLVHLDQRAQATVAPYQTLVDAGHHELADEYVDRQATAEGVHPDALRLAYRALDPTDHGPGLDEARARMAQAAEVYRERQLAPTEQSFLAQRGEPQPSVQLGEYRRKSLGTEPVRGNEEERDFIENAPARFRPALQAGVRSMQVVDEMASAFRHTGDDASATLLEGVKSDAITTLDQAVREGLDPAFVQGGDVKPGTLGAPPSLTLPKVKATGSRQFKSGETTPTSVADQTRLLVRRAKVIADNEAAMALQSSLGVKASEVFGDEIAGMTGKEIADRISDEGLKAWDPANPFDAVRADQITPDTPLIPQHVFNVYRNRFKEFSPDNLPLGLRAPVRANDLAMKGFKAGVLYLSPRWVVGHVIGHAILATFGAGLGPVEWVSALDRAKKVLSGDDLSSLTDQERSLLSEGHSAPGELIGRGQAGIDAGTQARLTPGPTPKGVHPIRWSQKAVAFTDDLDRVAIALAKAKKGLTPAELDTYRVGHPELADVSDGQLVNEYAIRESLKAQGDYTDLTNVEREVLGRLVLFYPWIKHMTRLTYQLAVHDPLRVAWALHLADLYGTHNQIPLTVGKVPLGNQWWLNLPKTDPFSHVFSNFGATGSGETPLATLNPVLDTLGAAGGLDLGKGQLLARPPGSSTTDQYGRPAAGFIGGRALASYLVGEQPQLSAATEVIPSLFGHNAVARYQTGEPYRVGHQDINDPSRLAPFAGGGSLSPLLSMFGIPYASKIDEDAIRARADARRKELESQRASYSRVLPGRAP